MNRALTLRLGWVFNTLAVLTLLLSCSPAFGQMSEQMVGGPISTRRFERLLRAYVQPAEGESAAPTAGAEPEVLTAKKDKEGEAGAAPAAGAKAAAPAKEAKKG